MSDLRKAAQMALEALQDINHYSLEPRGMSLPGNIDTAMDSLRAALESPPAAWAYKNSGRICDNKDGRMTAPEGWRPLYE